MKRSAGILLPVSSLPGGFAGGKRWVDWLVSAKQHYWQVLPLNPRDGFGSPYNSPRPFAIDSGYGTKKEWFDLKRYANREGVEIIGDLPYFVASGPKRLFLPGVFSGSPPDYYNKRGQYWGHPIYDWDGRFKENLAFLERRLTQAGGLYDVVRLDHFRGYAAVWAVPKGARSGRKGKWLAVPGERILKAVCRTLSGRRLIAEDLGVITEDVERWRQICGLLSTKVMLWHKREEIKRDCVLYTSVHDSNTVRGYTRSRTAVWRFIRIGMESEARLFVMAMQDVLNLGAEARLNRPGRAGGNWRWKMEWNNLTPDLARRLAEETVKGNRA